MNTLRFPRVVAAALLVLALPSIATAAVTPFSIENYGGQVGLGTADLKSAVISAIAWVLGIASLVSVVMVILGGFLWLTSAGNEEKLEKAKKTISSAVVGLVLVIISWAIVIFVAGSTRNVTGV